MRWAVLFLAMLLAGCSELAPAAMLAGWGFSALPAMWAVAVLVGAMALLARATYRRALFLLHCWHLAQQDTDRLAGRSRKAPTSFS